MDGYSHERSAIRIDYVTVLFAASQIEQCFSTATLPAIYFSAICGIVSPITLNVFVQKEWRNTWKQHGWALHVVYQARGNLGHLLFFMTSNRLPKKRSTCVYIYIYNCRWAKLSAWWSASRLGAPSSIQAYTTYMCYNYVYSNMYIYIYICSWHSFQSSIYIHEHFMKTNLNLNQSFPQQTSS